MNARTGRLLGKIALITGASGGQGLAYARLFADEGATVVLADIATSPGSALAAEISAAGGRAQFVKLDVCDREQWAQTIASTRSSLGSLHVLVNNAGIVSRNGIMDVSLDEWRRVIDVNLTGALNGMWAAAPLIRDSGGGSIINISSTSGLLGHAGAAYSASKWALRGLTKTGAMEFVDWKIRVNSVHPTQVAGTAIADSASGVYREVTQRIIPYGRPARAEEIASVVLFLASDDSSFMTGSEVTVDGGYSSFALPRLRESLIAEAKSRNR